MNRKKQTIGTLLSIPSTVSPFSFNSGRSLLVIITPVTGETLHVPVCNIILVFRATSYKMFFLLINGQQ